jgi:hypothetical protein
LQLKNIPGIRSDNTAILYNVARDFYRYFPFSRSNSNIFTDYSNDRVAFSLGLLIGALLVPFILSEICSAETKKVNYYIQDRVGLRMVKF